MKRPGKKLTKSVKRAAKKTVKRAAVRVAKNVGRAIVAQIATKVASRAAKRMSKNDTPKSAAEVPPRFTRVADAFANDAAVTSGVMMSAYGLKVNGKIFAMLPRGSFVVKLPRARVDELVAEGVGAHFDPGHGRLMKEWIAIDGHDDRWLSLARESYAFVKKRA
jgi:TfoX/Sxy family transcriptional regulator of competence genes